MTSKLLLKPYLSFSKETVRTSLFLLFLFQVCSAVQLENWRQPFFLLASEMEKCSSTSTSRMFWDNINTISLFDSSISVKTPDGNFWFFEPFVTAGAIASQDVSGEGYYHLELLNQLKFRNFLIQQSVDVDKRYEDDPLYPAHPDRAFKGRIEEAYGQFDWKYGFLRIGRLKRNWGPFADRSLFLSANPYSYDAFEWQIHSSFFEFRHLFAPFYNERTVDTDNGSKTNRFFTAHSLNFNIKDWVSIGISEAVVFARNSFPDMHYINPFSIYSVVNTNQEGSGNLMLAFQWNIHPFVKFISFRGQIAFDDFQVDDEIVTDKEPAHYGIDMGLFWNNPFKIPFEHLVKTEYTFRSQWLYTVSDLNGALGERYTYGGKSLGYPDNDGDRFSAAFSAIGNKFWFGTAELAYSRQGIRTVNSKWMDYEPGQIPGLPKDSSYTMEKTFSANLDAGIYFKNYLNLNLSFCSNWIKNKDNISSSNYEFSPSISAELTLHYSNLFVKLPK